MLGNKHNLPIMIRLLHIASFLYLVATTISFATTTNGSRDFIEPVRIVAAGGAVLIVAYVSIFCPASARRVRLSLLLCLLFLSYGFLLSILNNSIANSIDKPEYYIPILVLGAYLFAGQNPPIISKVLAQALFTYTLLIFILTVALGGFKFAFPPSFEYEYLSSVQNQDISYSQGISNIARAYPSFMALEPFVQCLLRLRKIGGKFAWLSYSQRSLSSCLVSWGAGGEIAFRPS